MVLHGDIDSDGTPPSYELQSRKRAPSSWPQFAYSNKSSGFMQTDSSEVISTCSTSINAKGFERALNMQKNVPRSQAPSSWPQSAKTMQSQLPLQHGDDCTSDHHSAKPSSSALQPMCRKDFRRFLPTKMNASLPGAVNIARSRSFVGHGTSN